MRRQSSAIVFSGKVAAAVLSDTVQRQMTATANREQWPEGTAT